MKFSIVGTGLILVDSLRINSFKFFSRDSIGLIKYFLTLSKSVSEIPSKTYKYPDFTSGSRNPSNCKHWSAESARWSYWPGRGSVPKMEDGRWKMEVNSSKLW